MANPHAAADTSDVCLAPDSSSRESRYRRAIFLPGDTHRRSTKSSNTRPNQRGKAAHSLPPARKPRRGTLHRHLSVA